MNSANDGVASASVVRLKNQDASAVLEDASEIAAKAFVDNPAYVEIFRGDATTRQQHLKDLFSRNFALVQTKRPQSVRCYYSDPSCHELLCVLMLVPHDIEFSMWDKIKAGLLYLFILFGYGAFSRLLRASDSFDHIVKEVMGDRRFLELQRMVVKSAYQGTGLGSKFLGEALKEADEQGLPVVLSTQVDRNLIFYRRL
jgi:GNAT superfamily N-acetyltransferase